MYTLYYAPGACSLSVHVTLEELGAEYKLHKVDMSKGEHKSPEFLKINPRGQVGALTTPDGSVSENAAMIIYLNDKHGNKLIPADGFERLKAMQWLMFANSGLHGAYSKVKHVESCGGSDEMIKKSCENVQAQWDEIEAELERNGTKFLAGDTITAGDVYATVVSNWSFIPNLPKFGPKTKELLKAVSTMPAYQRALEQEEIEYKALAA